MKKIGPSFASELLSAGLTEGVAWSEAGDLFFSEDVSEERKAAVQAVLDAHDPEAPAPVSVPASVTRYQARAALAEAGLLAQVNAYFAALPDDDMGKLAWNEAPTVHRNSDALDGAAQALGLTEQQIDALFIRADQF